MSAVARALARSAILATLLFAASPSFAATYGDVEITVRKEFGAPRSGRYFEQRLAIANRSANAHVAKITVESQSMRGGASRATRTFQIAPRSETVVTIPMLLMGYYTPGEATVVLDGQLQDEKVLLPQQSAWDADTNQNALLSRSVQYTAQPSNTDVQRPDVAPSEWPASWLQYDRYATIAVTASDWAQLSPAVHDAIDRWAFAGGVLMFVDPPDPMPAVSIRSTDGRYGLGHILVFEDGLFDESRVAKHLQWRGNEATVFNSAATEVPLLKDDQLPLRALYIVLILFAVVAGPVSLFVLAKKNRRMWIFGALPLLAIATSVLLIGATFASEGFVKIQRSLTITYLDETLGKAVTLGVTGFYATVSPRGEIRFASDTELRANSDFSSPVNGDTTWDDGQRLFGGWVGTRVPTYFAVRKSEPRRERMPLEFQADSARGVNGLGATIDRVWVASMDGRVFEAKNVAPGAAFALTRAKAREPLLDTAIGAAEGMMHGDTWMTILGNADEHPEFILQPGTYVAIVRDPPFLETAMDSATTLDRRGVVFGVSRVQGDSDAR